jgi:branched-chain amino acid transport system permease protein
MPSLPALLQYAITGVTVGAAYGLTGLGFTMIYNTTGVVNFAQGEFVMLGGMGAVFLLEKGGLPLPAAVLCSVLFVTLLGAAVHRAAVRPLSGRPVVILVIATIGVSILLRGGAMLAFGKDTFSLPAFSPGGPILVGGAAFLPQNVWVLSILLAVVGATWWFFHRTLRGKAMQACSCDAKAASLMGIPVEGMGTLSFALSALTGALGGAILAPVTMTSYDSGILLGMKGFAACILGGLGHPFGAVAGGLILGVLESLTAGLLSSGYKDAVAFVLLLLLLFLRPSGLLGKGSSERV